MPPKAPKGLPKNTCSVCKKTTNCVASNKEGSIKCSVCERWYHPSCVNVSADLYSKIQEWESEGFESPWTDEQCQSAYKKLSKEVKALSAKQEELEERQSEVEKKQEAASVREELRDSKVTKNEQAIREMQEKLDKLVAEKSNKAVFKEIGERARKENNLVFHMVPESASKDAGSRKHHDLQALGELSRYLDLSIKVEKAVKFWRRQGTIPEIDSNPRPLLVGFKRKEDMEMFLQNAKHLSECPDKMVAKVSIVKDLTKAQREEEADLLEEVKRKNLARSDEEISNKQCYKRVGKRGERYEIKVTMKSTESIDSSGLVLENQTVATGANAVNIGGDETVFGRARGLASRGRGRGSDKRMARGGARGVIRSRENSQEEASSPKRRNLVLSTTCCSSDNQNQAEQEGSGDFQLRDLEKVVPSMQIFRGLGDLRGEEE